MAIIGNGITTGAAGLDGMITVSDTQPTLPSNKVWVKETPGEIEIPTVDELEELKGEFESTVDYTESYNTVSGDIVSFDDGVAGKSLHKLLGTIEPIQDLHGYENPWPGGGNAQMIPDGTNTANGYIAGYILTSTNDTANNAAAYVSEYFPVVAGEQYTYSATVQLNTPAICWYDSNKTFISGVAANSELPKIVTAPENAAYARCTQYYQPADYKTQIEKGTTATTPIYPYSNICPISGHTGVEVTRAGKNLLPNKIYSNRTDYLYVGQDSDQNTFPIYLKAGEYTFSADNDINANLYFRDLGNAASTRITPTGSKNISIAFTIPKTTWYQLYLYSSGLTTSNLTKFQLEVGSIATEYEEYQSETTPISWQSKAGTIYGGSIDAASGKLVVDKGIVTFDGSQVTDFGLTPMAGYTQASWMPYINIGTANAVFISDKYKYQNLGDLYKIWASSMPRMFLGIPPEITTRQQLATYFASNPVTVVYPLATPIEYNLSSRAIKTLSGQNNIWIDTGSITECEYVTATSSVIDKLLPEATDEDLGKALLVKTVEDGRVTEYELGDVKEDLSNLAHVVIDTASGDIATFTDGADNQPIQKLVAAIEPVQDLHGYENPWPGGSTKNMFPVSDWFRAFNASSNYLLIGDTSIYLEAGTYTLSFEYYVDGATTTSSFWRTYSEQVTVADVSKQIEYNALGLSTTTTTWTTVTQTFTLQQNGWLGIDDGQLRGGIHYRKIQVESGSEKTDFIPYSNICPISGHTGMTVTRTGKNVWDEEWELGYISPTGQNEDNTSYFRSKNYIPVRPNTQYYFKCPNTYSWYARFRFYDQNKTFVSQVGTSMYMNNAFTTPENAYYMRFTTGEGIGVEVTYNHDISINYPSTDHDYHSGTDNVSIPITFPTTIYGGEYEVIGGDLVDNRVCFTATPDLTYFMASSTETDQTFYIRLLVSGLPTGVNGTCISNVFSQMIVSGPGRMVQTPNDIYFILPKSIANSIETLKAWIANNSVVFSYQRATPIEYTLSANELTTLYGTNNVWTDVGEVSVDYPADTKLYIDKKISEAVAALGA